MDDFGLFCLKGHCVNPFRIMNPDRNSNYCPECGQPTISHCPKCKAGIPGGTKDRAPNHCGRCAEPFPWAETSISRK